MTLKITVDDLRPDLVLIALDGAVDAASAGEVKAALEPFTTRQGVIVVLDMGSLSFIDSAGLGALIGGIRRTRESGGEVAVACGRPTLTRLLHTTGFDRIVPVTETVDEAADALLNPPDEFV